MYDQVSPLFAKLSECLVNAETSLKKNRTTSAPSLEELARSSRVNREKLRGFRGRESIFKRPEEVGPKTNFRPIPDYHRNPHKWTTYSLENVSDTSEEQNCQAALAFLKDIRRHKRSLELQESLSGIKKCKNEDQRMETDGTEERNDNEKHKNVVLFKKPVAKVKVDDGNVEDDKPKFRNGKLEMPEYVVGVRQAQKTKSKKKEATSPNKELRLNHLHEFEE